MIRYSIVVEGIAVTLAQDVFELVPGSGHSVRLVELYLSQFSDFADAQDEILSVRYMRGHTTTGSSGAAVTPAPFNRYLPPARSTAARNNTTVATSGTPETLLSDGFNVRAGWYWRAPELDPKAGKLLLENAPYAGSAERMPGQIILGPSERAVLRISAPADELTLNATQIFEELG